MSTPICPVHFLHHRSGPCAQAKALRNRAPATRGGGLSRGRGGSSRGSATPRPVRAPQQQQQQRERAPPGRAQAPRTQRAAKPNVTCDITKTIVGAPSSTVAFWSLDSTRRTELHPKFIGCELKSLRVQWLSYSAPQEVSGRIWFLVLGSNEPEPTATTIKAHSKGFSFKAGVDGTSAINIAKYEHALLAAKQADHHFGGVRVAYLADITHTATTTITTITHPAVPAREGEAAVPARTELNTTASTTEVGVLKIMATFNYDAHADV